MTYQRKTKYPPRQPRRFNLEAWLLFLALLGVLVVLLCDKLGLIPHPEPRPTPPLVVEAAQ